MWSWLAAGYSKVTVAEALFCLLPVLGLVSACGVGPASAAELVTGTTAAWSQFRGAGGDGLVAAGVTPTQWGAEKNIVWKVPLPGFGWSQPVVWGGKIFVTTAVTDRQTKPKGGQARSEEHTSELQSH